MSCCRKNRLDKKLKRRIHNQSITWVWHTSKINNIHLLQSTSKCASSSSPHTVTPTTIWHSYTTCTTTLTIPSTCAPKPKRHSQKKLINKRWSKRRDKVQQSLRYPRNHQSIQRCLIIIAIGIGPLLSSNAAKCPKQSNK